MKILTLGERFETDFLLKLGIMLSRLNSPPSVFLLRCGEFKLALRN